MSAPATADAVVSVGPGFFHEALPLTQLQPSPLNPRKRFEEIEALAGNIKAVGVLHPLLARPVGDHYEIVAGERRYQAATRAGLTAVPVTVRHLSDAQALEIMVIENNQRKDVNALEEADGFSRLLQAGYQIDRLATRIGRSKKYVYDRVKLLALVPEAQQLVLDGRITASHAILLARLTPEHQARAIDPAERALFEFDNFGIEDRTELTTPDPYANAHAISVRELEGWIDEHVRLDLAQPVDADLFPEAAVAQERAEEVVSITHYAFADVDNDVLTGRLWKRADVETCDRSVLGVVVIGPERGTAFRVCVDRGCDVHWAHERKGSPRGPVGAVAPDDDTDDEPAPGASKVLAERQPWEEQRERDEADRARYQQAEPALRKAFLARVKALKEPALVDFVLRCGDISEEELPKAKTAIDVLRMLTWEEVARTLASTWAAPTHVPKLAKTLGVDLKPLLKNAAKPVQTSAPKKAAKTSVKKKARKKR